MGVGNHDVFHSQELYIAVGLAAGGNFLIGVSYNLQKYTQNRLDTYIVNSSYGSAFSWWASLFLMVLGELSNFAAFGFAPASRVAPLGVVTVISNMMIAVLFLKQKIRPQDIFGSVLSILGVFVLIYFVKKSEFMVTDDEIKSFMTSTGFILYVVVELIALGSLITIRQRFEVNNILVLVLIASIVGSFTVISAKAVSSMLALSITGVMQLKSPIFWIMLVVMLGSAAVEIIYLNITLKGFDAAIVLPTHFIFSTISAILAGVICYQEFHALSGVAIFIYSFGCMLCFAGVMVLTSGRDRTAAISGIPTIDEPMISPKDDNAKSFVNFFPSWLLSTVNQAQVQPISDPFPHAMDASGYKYRKISICRQSSTESEDSQEETEIKSEPQSPSAPQKKGTIPKTKGSGSKMPARLGNTLCPPK